MTWQSAMRFVLRTSLLIASAPAARAQCQPQWLPADAVRGTDAPVWAMATWDPDGDGPRSPVLIAGGDFSVAGRAAASHVAQWDGSEWSPVGEGTDGSVYTVLRHDPDGDGPAAPSLIIGGAFREAEGLPASHIAAWDGSRWSALGAGMNGWVQALATFDRDGAGPQPPLLVAAGSFDVAGTGPARRIAAWDGARWAELGGGTNDNVSALLPFDPDGAGPRPPALIAAGRFTEAGGSPAERIAAWDGAHWSPLGAGVAGPFHSVESLASFDPDGGGPQPALLIAGGRFTSAGGVAANNIAAWNGSEWTALGPGLEGTAIAGVYSLMVVDADGPGPGSGRLIAGGSFRDSAGSEVNSIAEWDGLAWKPFAGGIDGTVRSLASFDADGTGPAPAVIAAGGNFAYADADPANHSAIWDGSAWSSLGGGINSWVNALAAFDPDGAGPAAPLLAAGGSFYTAGDAFVNHVALWDGEAWSALGAGMNAPVFTLLEHDPDGDGPGAPVLVAGGSFSLAGGASARSIAAWNGLAWTRMGSGMPGSVTALAEYDPDGDGPQPALLIAGGEFVSAGGLIVNNIAAWDGALWKPLGSGVHGRVRALATFDPDEDGPTPAVLIAGGEFLTAGGAAASRIAAWDGVSWQPLTTGVNRPVQALITFNPRDGGLYSPLLVVGGDFTTAGGLPAGGLAAWNGAGWSAIGPGVDGGVNELALFDEDGPGPGRPALIVGGEFTTAGGQPARNIAAWDVEHWSSLGSGLNGPVSALLAHDPARAGPALPTLFAGGRFSTFLARLGCAPCAADLTADGLVDFGDYLAFLTLYDARDPAVDFNRDGQVDFSDYLEFLDQYDAGC